MKFTTKFLALIFCVLQSYETAAQIELEFGDYYHYTCEGRNGNFYVYASGGTPSNDVVLRLIPLTYSGFQNYINAHSERTFSHDIAYYTQYIHDPAEYEEESGGRRDFNNTEFFVVLEASQYNVEVEVTDTLILDDDIHETYEGFVIVLEIEQSDPAENITLSEYYSVLVIEICDNDEIHLGFGLPSVTVPESIGVLTNILYIEKLNNQESEINITLSVGLSQSPSNLTTSAVPDEDYRPVAGGQYSYEIQLTPDQQIVPAAPIEIIDDMSVEENEVFLLSLTAGPQAAVEITANASIATVLIIDNDGMNECENEGLCGPFGECVDMQDGYYCECQDGYYYYPATGRCETLSVVLDLPRSFPIKEVQGRGVCYSQDTVQDRMEINEEIQPILREFSEELDNLDGSGSD